MGDVWCMNVFVDVLLDDGVFIEEVVFKWYFKEIVDFMRREVGYG